MPRPLKGTPTDTNLFALSELFASHAYEVPNATYEPNRRDTMTNTRNTSRPYGKIRIHIYRAGPRRTWYGARWINDEYDGCDELEVEHDAPMADAIAEAETMPLLVDGPRAVHKVEDSNRRSR